MPGAIRRADQGSSPMKRYAMMTRTLSLLLMLLAGAPAFAQTRLRIATYHLSDYTASAARSRAGSINDVLKHIGADIVLVQGVAGSDAASLLFESATLDGATRPSHAPFAGEGESGNGMLYDPTRTMLIAHMVIAASPRAIDEYIVAPYNTSDTIHIFAAHLAGSNDAGAQRAREAAARTIRERASGLPASHHYIIAGDLNMYGTEEPAYAVLTAAGERRGAFVDPLGEGAGLNGRFDIILVSPSLAGRYVAGSYNTVGNDAVKLGSAKREPSAAIDPQLRRALGIASDHLPVYADFIMTTARGADVAGDSPFPAQIPFTLSRGASAFAQPKASAKDFPGIMRQTLEQRPTIDLFGTPITFEASDDSKPNHNSKWWGPPPSAPVSPSGRSAEP